MALNTMNDIERIALIVIVLINLSPTYTQNISINNAHKIETINIKNVTYHTLNSRHILRINSEKPFENGADDSVPKFSTAEKVKSVNLNKVKSADVSKNNPNGSVEQDPILSSLLSFKGGQNMDVESWTKLSWLMELFDHHKWEKRHYANVSNNCSDHMTVYLDALRSGKTWAAKMSDASGRYNGQFLFGNDFWLGSSALCKELQIDLEVQGKQSSKRTPPFPAGFNVARLQISVGDFTPQIRTLLMGICMPSSCGPRDLEAILRSGAAEAEAAAVGKMAELSQNGDNVTQERFQLKVVLVRPVPGPYDMWQDVKFYIVGGVGALAVVIIVIASIYEGYINRYNDAASNGGDDVETDNNNMVGGGNCNGPAANGNTSPATGNGNAAATNGACEKNHTRNKQRGKMGTGNFSRILLSFSALSNTEKIMRTEESTEDSINCIHGLRFLSLAWVIMVHTYIQVFAVADNKTLRTVIERNFFYQTVGNASYSVDTFFFISGLLVTFLYYKSLDTKQKALAKKNAKLASQNAGNTTNGSHFGQASNGEHAKIQMHQYAYVNHAMASQSHTAIGRSNSTQPIVDQEQFQVTNTVFTRQTCTKEVKDNVSEFITLLFYRIVRLTPAYLFVIGVNELAVRYSHNNSVFDPHCFDHLTCAKHWWRNALYINNLYPQTEMCMVWSWYMANDTQFYVIGIILLLISKRHFKISAAILIILLISSWLTTGYISLANNYRAKIQEPFEMFDQIYDKPWSRLGPYLIGMMTGWYLYRRRNSMTLPTWAVVIGWPCAMAVMASIVYGMRHGHLELWPTAFYVSIGHTAWSVATAWVVVCCVSQRGGLVARALSYRGVLPLSRLAYCAYLVHPTIMMLSTYQMDGPVHLHNGIVLIIYAGNTVMSYLMSFAISLAFEAPVVRLLKIDFRAPRNKNK